ncbi:MAG: epoxyqueuosine reductase QueH [Brevinematales bacterium]
MNKKRMLLHTCCAPCLTQCLNVLTGGDKWEKALRSRPEFDIALYFDNPNISPEAEYSKRKGELGKVIGAGIAVIGDDSEDRRNIWREAVRGFEGEPEKGKRCFQCYSMRLERTFSKAHEENFDSVATTLTLSPWKDSEKINEIGAGMSKKYGIEYIESDFKKNDGYRKSAAACSRLGVYRQDYCGCKFSVKRAASPIR